MVKTRELSTYYVYVLFDYLGIPRYVGKGKGKRWESHGPNDSNKLKAAFIRRTLAKLGEIPKIRVYEDLREDEAFAAEILLISILGQISLGNGSLTNLTAGGDGFDSETSRKAGAASWAKLTPEERSERARKMALAITPEHRQETTVKGTIEFWASLTPEERFERSRKAMAGLTPEQRRENGLKAASLLTPEQRREKGRKAGRASAAVLTSEERSNNTRRGMLALSPEVRQNMARKAVNTFWEKLGPEERKEVMRKRMSPEQRREWGRKGARISALNKKNKDQ